jgi:hypothetical protein
MILRWAVGGYVYRKLKLWLKAAWSILRVTYLGVKVDPPKCALLVYEPQTSNKTLVALIAQQYYYITFLSN